MPFGRSASRTAREGARSRHASVRTGAMSPQQATPSRLPPTARLLIRDTVYPEGRGRPRRGAPGVAAGGGPVRSKAVEPATMRRYLATRGAGTYLRSALPPPCLYPGAPCTGPIEGGPSEKITFPIPGIYVRMGIIGAPLRSTGDAVSSANPRYGYARIGGDGGSASRLR